ncbi:hypothetical protein [Adhaeretor mobilis]|uniref:O-antigen polysaccharide polymerase Wzy n=1 Tax=Adhaeretor mobilis TaxID=1930276 RepID=A0A517MRM0_9BACT|nr:hypothetical protein [Adhaeretor mobilis]QDS97528.1 hypothetical protein HG15A2_07910 [Adhaeretor mobilis]
MPPEKLLILFSWILIAVLGLAILVPYIRRRSDLITAKNIFLLGSINFVGIAGLVSGYSSEKFKILEYERSDYMLFMCGAIVFFVTMFASYHLIKFPKRLAGKYFRKWPSASGTTLFVMLGIALLMGLVSAFPPNIVGISSSIVHIGNKGTSFAMALAFVAWYRQKKNPILIAGLLAVLLFSMLLAIRGGGGRRSFVAVLAAIPICLYWLSLRYRKPKLTLSVIAGIGVLGFLALSAYTVVRHFDRRGDKTERTFASSFEAIKLIPSKLFNSDVDAMLGQNAVQVSLTAIHLYRDAYRPEPFHTVYFVLSNPIPRALWENKPVGLGYSLPKKTTARTRATWGPGIVGHGFHEGGLHMLVFYGLLVGVSLRFFDELLVRQAGNPYILGMLTAMSGHLIGWTRGDIGTFTLQIILSAIAGLLIAFVGRLITGTGLEYPRANWQLAAPRRRRSVSLDV